MKKEFKSLDEKIQENRDFEGGHLNYKFIDAKDVKEAVRLLKEEIDRETIENTFNEMGRRVLRNIINQIFGDELSK